MMLLIRLTTQQQGKQSFGAAMTLQVIDLLLIVLVNEGLDCSDGGIH
jgi:hypothetical protein